MLSTAPGTLADVPVVLLDLDGTLVDSGPGILAALEHAFAACGERLPPPEVLRTFIGPPLVESFQHTLGLSAARADQLGLAYVEHYQDNGLLNAPPYPGIPALLRRLAADGRTVAVATNKPETTAHRLLEHQGLDGELTLIGGTDRAVGRTDKSAVIGSVLHRLGLAPADAVTDPAADGSGASAEGARSSSPPAGAAPSAGGAAVVMIGDRIHDAEGAAEHGLPAFLAGWGYGGPAEQRAGVPRIDSVHELTAMLLG